MPRVLIVDDEENQRRTLSIGLRLEGFDVVVSSSSQEALRALGAAASGEGSTRAHGIDLALIDLMMPGLNGPGAGTADPPPLPPRAGGAVERLPPVRQAGRARRLRRHRLRPQALPARRALQLPPRQDQGCVPVGVLKAAAGGASSSTTSFPPALIAAHPPRRARRCAPLVMEATASLTHAAVRDLDQLIPPGRAPGGQRHPRDPRPASSGTRRGAAARSSSSWCAGWARRRCSATGASSPPSSGERSVAPASRCAREPRWSSRAARSRPRSPPPPPARAAPSTSSSSRPRGSPSRRRSSPPATSRSLLMSHRPGRGGGSRALPDDLRAGRPGRSRRRRRGFTCPAR